MLKQIANFILGSKNDRILKDIQPLVYKVNDLEVNFKDMSDSELKKQTTLFRERIDNGEPLDLIEPEAFAVVREAARRTLGMRHFDVQIIGGHVLHTGSIAEMKTGEGKTLVATLPAYLNGLSGKGVHIVTVNDYLAKRDAEWMGQVHKFLGLSVDVVYSGMDETDKQKAYAADITYGQNNEFGFDYLRDNMKFSAEDLVQRNHHFAIVDEVDSILIDEARTPLIISGPSEDSTDKYYKINKIIPYLKQDEHYEIDLKSKVPALNENGINRAEELLEIENLYDPENIEILHHVNQGLRAHTTMERDVDYVIQKGKVVIVDEFTGRLMEGRRWSNGLHQAVEAKEGLNIERENQTLASITFQNLFRLYDKLAGMTGTAETEAEEFAEIYALSVVSIPTNKPLLRIDENDAIYRTREEKYNAVGEEIIKVNKTGQPILVGTISIEQSESLSRMLTKNKVKHNVLNAKQHAREAEIVAQAGRFGAVTIATNMAGRGTDILLGGNPEFLAYSMCNTKDKESDKYKDAFKEAVEICAKEKEQVLEAGGLLILGTERHESRRIDNQLRGRAGRQGDPGRTRFYISMEDELMRRFGGERLQSIMSRMGWEEGLEMEGKIISRSIESAQKKVEGMHFEGRKHVTQYDDVMNRQRQIVYGLRRIALQEGAVRPEIVEMIDDVFEEAVLSVCDEKIKPMDWDLEKLKERYEFLTTHKIDLPSDIELDQQKIFDFLRKEAKEEYNSHVERQQSKLYSLGLEYKEKGIQLSSGRSSHEFDFKFESFEREIFLETLDRLWNEHLGEMDHLREGIGLRGYAQKNPLHEYQREAFIMFQGLLMQIKEMIIRGCFFRNADQVEQVLAHLREEFERREALMKKAKEAGQEEEQAGGGALHARTPEEQRAKLEQQKKKRRRMKK